jgi:DNA-binding YbaB/EbfC family protein
VSQFDLSTLMQQAQALQEKFKEMQEAAAAKTVEAQSGGGMVRVTVDGAMRLRRVEIDPKLLASNDKAMLEDLLVVAVNDGLHRAQELVAQEMGKLGPLGGLKIPGLFGNE